MLTVVNNVCVVDESVGVDEVNGVGGESILWKDALLLTVLWTQLESTGNVISQVDEFGLVTDPSFTILFQLNLMYNCMIMELQDLHP